MSHLEQDVRDEMDATEELLSQVRARWDTAPTACLIVDPMGVVVDLNVAACDWLGIRRVFALRKPLAALFRAAYRAVTDHLRRARRSANRTTNDIHIAKYRQGRLVLRLISMPIRDGLLQVVLADATEKRSTDAVLRFLADASLRLGAFLDADVAAGTATQLAVPVLADICTFDRKVDGHWVSVAQARHERNQAALPEGPACGWLPRIGDAALHARESGEMVVLDELTDLENDPRLPSEKRAAVKALGLRCAVVAPVMAGPTNVGVLILFTAGSGRAFDAESLALVRELMRRVDSAFANIAVHDKMVELARAKDEFLSHVSHELREPLTALRTWSRVARQRKDDPAGLDEALRIIEEAVNRNARLVSDLVEVVRSPSSFSLADAGLVDVADVVKDVLTALGPACQKAGIEAVIERTSTDDLVWGDRARLRQVVTNLVSNAVRHARSAVVVSIGRFGEMVRVGVRDDGHGIHPELVPELFQPFPRHRDRAEDNLGIGLAVVKRLVELHGGEVRADAGGGQTGRGATFTVSLPRHDEAAEFH